MTAEHDLWRSLLADMIRIRVFEERCAELYGESKIRGFLHLYIGEEAIASGVMSCLERTDAVLATYREHGHALLRGVSARSIMAEMFGKVQGCSGGRGGSMHLFDRETRFFGGNAIVGGGLPLAVGLALAAVVGCTPSSPSLSFVAPARMTQALSVVGDLGWTVELLDPVTLGVIARDTNADGTWDGLVPNTGTLQPGSYREYLLRVSVPPGATSGLEHSVTLTATSDRSDWAVAYRSAPSPCMAPREPMPR